MPQITSSVATNGLPVHRVALPGTRATTVLVAFDAGARTERPEENGMAHFLEHLVFKGGQIYDDYRKVNETAERMGGSLNAYTSHDLVAFHITVRAESAMEAIDLLTDFVGRPKIDPAELDKERGVVIQEIQRYKDQPAAVAEELIDRAHFGDHPLGRTVLGPEDHLRTFSRDAIVAFRERRWSGARGGAFVVGNVEHLPANGKVDELFARFPDLPQPEAYVPAPPFEPRTLVEQRDTNQSHLRMSYRPQVPVDDPKARAAFTIYATLLGGSMGSRLFDEIREQRGLCYSVYAADHAYADVPVLQLGSGLESSKCAEAYTRMRGDRGRTGRRRAHARGGRAGARLRGRPAGPGLREHQRGGALRGQPADRLRRGHRSRRRHRPARRGHLRRGRRGGPHRRPRQARGGLRRPPRERRVLILLNPLAGGVRVGQNALVPVAEALNERELSRYVSRVSDRWPLSRALLGGARADDARGAAPQRERGPEYVVLLVSERFDGVPWLERVYQCGALWDAAEMGDHADVHCYTPLEFERKRESLPLVRRVSDVGFDLLA